MRSPRTILAALFVASFMLPAAAQVRDLKDIKTPPLRTYTPPQPKRIVLGNGLVIFLQEDHELPLIRGTAVIRGGGREVPADKAGLIGIYASSWRTGGTTSKSGDELDEFLESRAARVETSADEDSTAVRMDILKGDFDAVFPIFLDLLRNPAFRQEKIDLAKTQANTGISRRNDEPGSILARETNKLGYGVTSPYARQPEYATVASITRDDLLAFHKRFVHPNNIIVGFVGDFDSAKMEATLRKAFGSWARGPQAPPPTTDMTPAKPGVYFIAKDDVTQANISMVHTGTLRSNPDYPAIQVMNEIFGGGFSGRLMSHLRSQMGLTYGVGGSIGSDWDHPGLFRITTSTKSGTTAQTIEALKKELADLLSQPFTAEELSLAKDSILNAYIFTTDSNEKLLNQRIGLEFYGYPADFYQRFPTLIEKVTADDVARVARKYVHPENLAILVVGNEKDFDKPLTSFGTVTPIDITIPEVNAGEKKAAPAAGSSAEAKDLARKTLAYVGGPGALEPLKSLRTVSSMTRKTPQGMMELDVDSLTRYPDDHRVTMKMPMGEVTMVMTANSAFLLLPGGGVQDMPGSQRDAMRQDSRHDLVATLRNIDNPAYTYTIVGSEKVGEVDTRVLEVATAGTAMRWLIDPRTGRVLRKISSGRGPQGSQITEFTEWKDYGGLKLPSAFRVIVGGEEAGSGQVKSVEINPKVEDTSFKKP